MVPETSVIFSQLTLLVARVESENQEDKLGKAYRMLERERSCKQNFCSQK
jgi:hypothetical protein